MSVIISSSLAIADSESGGGILDADNPLIGYQTRATTANISSTTAATGFPVTNLVNPSTNLRWKGVSGSPQADEYITLNLATAELVDYLAIARHNFGTAGITVSVEVENTATSPVSWDEVISETLLANDSPLLFRFTPQGITKIRVRLQPGSAAPFAAVIYCGKLLVVQRRLYVGHTPINYGRVSEITNGRAEAGHFLGRIQTRQTTKTSVELNDLTPAWYRDNIEPFLLQAQLNPFFFAWRPSSYPREVGFAWLTNDPQPVNERPNGMMQVNLELSGVV